MEQMDLTKICCCIQLCVIMEQVAWKQLIYKHQCNLIMLSHIVMNLQVTFEEIENIVKGFTDISELAQHGIIVGGTKYMLIQGELGQVIRGKKVCA